MKTLMAAAAFLLLLPAAQAQDAKPAAASKYTGTLEFNLGFGGSYTVDPDKGKSLSGDSDGLLGVTPAIDKQLGETVAIGGELGFVWLGADSDAKDIDRTLAINPNFRLRMSFPIIDKVTFDGLIALGPAFWLANDSIPKLANGDDAPGSGFRFGFAYRFNFGGSYKFNDAVAAFLNIGYYSTTSIGDDRTITQSSIPLNIGLRSAF